MAAFSTELERNVNLQLGSKNFGPFNVDDDIRHVWLEFTRDQWTNPNARLDVSVEVSIAGGPFVFVGGFTAFGGPPPVGKPNIVAKRVDLGEGTGRRVQGTYTVSGQRIRTTVTLRGDLVNPLQAA